MANPTYFLDDSVVTIRSAEVPNADWAGGMNAGGSNSSGVGINADGGEVVGSPEQFTLEDQHEAARTPQASQAVGGEALGDGKSGLLPQDSIRIGTNSATGNGVMTGVGNATLASLAAGWTAA